MKFKIINQCFQKLAPYNDNGDFDFYLEEDKWDDYGYHTLYHVHAGKKLTKDKPEYIGPINIMKKGQKMNDIYLIRKDIGVEFNELPVDFCSISMSVDFYRGLEKILKDSQHRKTFIESLNLILSVYDKIYEDFATEDCFSASLLRNAHMDAYAISLGKEILLDETSNYDLAKIPLTFELPNGKGKVEFDFCSIESEIRETIEVPSRLFVCIGNNGAGKSTILYRLARILFATPSERSGYAKDLGSISPSDAGFRRLFLISYSSFDSFILPGVDQKDYRLILNGLENKEGRLVYCGIRDIKREYEEKIDDSSSDWSNGFSFTCPVLDKDHERQHKLKTIDDLAAEYLEALNIIISDQDRNKIWKILISECIKANDLLEEIGSVSNLYLIQYQNTIDVFKQLSTGIKYLLHSLSVILSRIERNSIIIFDEPENHIQPPLLCKFIYCLRIISHEYRSLVLVATHSPVIVQETLANNVRVVSRNGDIWSFRKPSIETFGENIGNITDEVFKLNTSVTNYHKTASMLFEKYKYQFNTRNPLNFLKSVSDKTGLELGNGIRAYLIARCLENNE